MSEAKAREGSLRVLGLLIAMSPKHRDAFLEVTREYHGELQDFKPGMEKDYPRFKRAVIAQALQILLSDMAQLMDIPPAPRTETKRDKPCSN